MEDMKIELIDKDPAKIQYFNPTDNWGAEVYKNDVLMAESKILDAMDNNVLMTASEIQNNDFKVDNDFLPMIQDVYQLVEQHVELVGDSSLEQVKLNLACLVWHLMQVNFQDHWSAVEVLQGL